VRMSRVCDSLKRHGCNGKCSKGDGPLRGSERATGLSAVNSPCQPRVLGWCISLCSAFPFWSRPRARLFWPTTTLVQFRYQAPSTQLQARKLGNCCNYAVSQARAPVLSSRATGFLAGADWLGWTIPNCPCATSFGGTSALELCQWWSRQPGIKDACESRGRRGANSRW